MDNTWITKSSDQATITASQRLFGGEVSFLDTTIPETSGQIRVHPVVCTTRMVMIPAAEQKIWEEDGNLTP